MYYLNEKGARIYTLKVKWWKLEMQDLKTNYVYLITEKNTNRWLPDFHSSSRSLLTWRQIFSPPTDHQEAIWNVVNTKEGESTVEYLLLLTILPWHLDSWRSRVLTVPK